VVGAASGSVAGVVVGRLGPRRIAVSALVLMAVASVVGAGAADGWLLFASRFGESAGFLGVFVAVPSLIVDHTHPRHRAVVFGLWGAHVPIGHALAVALGPVVLGLWDWRLLWVLSGVLLAVSAVVLLAATGGARTTGLARDRRLGRAFRDLREVFAVPDVRYLSVCFLCYSAQWLPVVGFLPTLYVAQRHSIQTAGLLTAAVVVVNAVGNVSAGTVIRAGVPRRVVACAASASMGLCSIGIFASGAGFWVPYAFALLFSLTGGLLPATVLASVPDVAPSHGHVPAVSGLVAQGANLGAFLGPVAIGALASATGTWAYSPVPLLGLAMIGVGASLRLDRGRRPAAQGAGSGSGRYRAG
jgi:CP family cyanate transporter-like MFS transporter